MSKSTHTPSKIGDVGMNYNRCPQYWKDSYHHPYSCSVCLEEFRVNDRDHEIIETEYHTGNDVVFLHFADSCITFVVDLDGFPNKHVCPNCIGDWWGENMQKMKEDCPSSELQELDLHFTLGVDDD
tara:strand:+ start:176 stop:553 length:378 start_codon:yes stop_codon:yes gene_type:complete